MALCLPSEAPLSPPRARRIVHDTGFPPGGIVLAVTPVGLLVMKMRYRSLHNLRYFSFSKAPGDMTGLIFTMPIVDLAGVKVAKAVAQSPAAFANEVANKACPQMAFLRTAGAPQDVWESAAREGFKCMPAFLLPKLMALRRMRFPAGKRPSREKDMIAALIKDILPNEAEALIPLAWGIRCCKDRDHWKSVFDDPACLDKLETSLDLDDLCEIKASAQKRAARNKAIDKSRFQDVEKPSAPPVAASLAGEASQAGDAPPTWRVRPLPSGDEDVDLALARGFLPPLRGVTLSKDLRRFSTRAHVRQRTPRSRGGPKRA